MSASYIWEMRCCNTRLLTRLLGTPFMYDNAHAGLLYLCRAVMLTNCPVVLRRDINTGSYGAVALAVDRTTNEQVSFC